MTTTYYTPADNTTPYTSDDDGTTMTVKYANIYKDGTSQVVERAYTKQGGQWRRGTWSRIKTPASPPTNPPSGTYVVSEYTDEPPQWTTRETGTYHE